MREFVYLFGNTLFETLKPRSRKMLDTFVQTVRSLSGEFGYDPITNLPKFSISLGAIQNPEYTLDEIFRYIDLADKPCLIAIDEFQQIVRYPEKMLKRYCELISNIVAMLFSCMQVQNDISWRRCLTHTQDRFMQVQQ